MSKAVGIDLGTTNSVAAFKWAGIEVVTHDEVNRVGTESALTPSAVALREGNFVVGRNALNQSGPDVVVSIKRLMGRSYSDPAVQSQIPRCAYKIVAPKDGTDQAVSVLLNGREYQPEDISAEILKQLVRNAQAHLEKTGKGGRVDQVVITIPAYFDDKQRDATRMAAERAGIRVQQLLPEPTAAAISYGMIPGVNVNSVLVYDFGGGTFDASLLSVAENMFIELSKAGNLWLGGDDLDHRIMDHVKSEVARVEGLDDIDAVIKGMPHYDRIRFERALKEAAEKAKIDLSVGESTRILPSAPLLDELGMQVPIDVLLKREQFEALILPRVEESIEIAMKALHEANYILDMVDAVLLVGGSSQIPLVQQKAREAFGDEKVVVHPRPMTAVAEGAAHMAAGHVEKVGGVSRDYCIRLENDPQFTVIRRNDTLPVKAMFRFKTIEDNQRLACFEFFSPDWVSRKEDPIGKMWLAIDSDHPKGTTLLTVLELEEGEEILKATASVENAPQNRVSKLFSRGRSDQRVFEELEELIVQANGLGLTAYGVEEAHRLSLPLVDAANHMLDSRTGEKLEDQAEKAEKALKELRAFASEDHSRADYLAHQLEMLTEVHGALIPVSQRERMDALATRLRAAMDRNDLSDLQAASEEAERELKALPSEVEVLWMMHTAVKNANTAGSSEASILSGKLSRIADAFHRGNGAEASRLIGEVGPMADRWLSHQGEERTVVTGIAR